MTERRFKAYCQECGFHQYDMDYFELISHVRIHLQEEDHAVAVSNYGQTTSTEN